MLFVVKYNCVVAQLGVSVKWPPDMLQSLDLTLCCCRFGADGYIDLTVKDFAYWHQGQIDLSQIGFFVTTSEAEAQLEVALSQVSKAPCQAAGRLKGIGPGVEPGWKKLAAGERCAV